MFNDPPPARAAILTCMDPRLQLPRVPGQTPGETFILRNGGGRVTEDVLRGLVLCTRLLQVTEVGVIQHTDCRLQQFTNEELTRRTGLDIDFRAFTDPVTSIVEDVDRLSTCGLLGPGVRVWGGLYRVEDHTVRVVTDTRTYANNRDS